MPCVKMPQGDTMKGPLDTFIQKPEPVIPKMHSGDILPAGKLKVGPLARSKVHPFIPATKQGPSSAEMHCTGGTSISCPGSLGAQLLLCSSSSPLWHWPETPTGHTVGNEIRSGICKDDAFLDSLTSQMLNWGSGHLLKPYLYPTGYCQQCS